MDKTESNEEKVSRALRFGLKMQRDRVNDAIVQVRTDSRILAGIAAYFLDQNVLAPTVATLVRMALEAFHDSLVNSGFIEEIMTVSDATFFLSQLGLSKVNPSERGLQAYRKQLQRESLQLSGVEVDPRVPLKLSGTTKKMQTQRAKFIEREVKQTLDGGFTTEIGDSQELERRIRELDNPNKLERIKANTPDGFVVSNTDELVSDKLSRAELEKIRVKTDREQLNELKQGLGVIPRNIIAKEEQEDDEQAGDESGNER